MLARYRAAMDPWREIALFGQRVCATRDPLGVQDFALSSMLRLVGADAAGLYVLDARQRPRQVTRLGACDALVYEIESLGRKSDPFLRQVLASRQPVDDGLLYGTASRWPQRCERGRVLAAHGFAHSMVVPLLYDARLIATINLARSTGAPPFAVQDGRVAMELGRFTTIALANALQHATADSTAPPPMRRSARFRWVSAPRTSSRPATPSPIASARY